MAIVIDGTNGVSGVDGSAGTPAVQGSDTNTGVFFPAADTAAIATGGSERMRIDSSGNVGIGTASPGSLLNVVSNTNAQSWVGLRNNNTGSSASTGVLFGNDGNAAYGAVYLNSSTNSGFGAANGMVAGTYGAYPIAFITSSAERMRINSSGNVGIGTSTLNGAKLVVSQGSDQSPSTSGNMTTGMMVQSGDGSAALNFGTDSDGVWYNAAYANNAGVARIHRWLTGGTERMRIDSSGNLLVGTTSVPSTGAGTNSTIVSNKDYSGAFAQIVNSSSTSGTQYFVQFGRGSAECGKITSTGTNSTTYTTSSDYRLKKEVQPMTGALAKVVALKPVTYKWKSDGSESEGFIAHELAEMCPQAVVGEKDDVYEDGTIKPQGIDTSFLVATLTAAIQEQQAIIEQLKADVAALK